MYQGTPRRPVVAGAFYPAEPHQLRAEIERYLAAARRQELPGEVVGLVSPHAGYVYSGPVAASAYRQVAGEVYDLVVVVSPSHRTYFAGFSVYSAGDYLTPLGEVPVDLELARRLQAEYDGFHFVPQAHAGEHALEVQLPFLQVALPAFRLLPLIMLLVASSDLSHYHPQEEAVLLDRRLVAAVEANDPRQLWQTVESGQAEACGAGPMTAVMLTAARLGATASRVLDYRTSGDTAGDRRQVVGYLAAVFCRED
ncbi:MAG: AmmeMemoRadiSam system protein B [Deltaproteobacteria bacterium]|nr:AmmeMemoRadiSam system protein B [Deltaproteobacteria bacterium]